MNQENLISRSSGARTRGCQADVGTPGTMREEGTARMNHTLETVYRRFLAGRRGLSAGTARRRMT
jgi:hypothetical protein